MVRVQEMKDKSSHTVPLIWKHVDDPFLWKGLQRRIRERYSGDHKLFQYFERTKGVYKCLTPSAEYQVSRKHQKSERQVLQAHWYSSQNMIPIDTRMNTSDSCEVFHYVSMNNGKFNTGRVEFKISNIFRSLTNSTY